MLRSSWSRWLRRIVIGSAVAAIVFGIAFLVAVHQAANEIGEAGALGGGAGGYTDVAWSPDGRSVVVGRSEEGGDHLYRIPIATHDLQRLDPNQDGDFEPSVSPDGTRLAFTRFDDVEGGSDLYVAAGDLSNARALTHTTDDVFDPAWSPDGRVIAFIRGDTE